MRYQGIRGLSGYATLTDPMGPRKEADTFTCGHCQRIVHIDYKTPLDDLGGRCVQCDQLICKHCIATGRCDPFEKKLKRIEQRALVRRSYEESSR